MTESIIQEPEPRLGIDSAPVHEAEQLTNGGDLAKIKLRGQLYVLRITRAGKLILTK